jgi:hypothetical protein
VLGCVSTYTMDYAVKTISNGGTRETREGWPLLSVENEVNGDSKSTNERGPSLVGSPLGSSCRYKRLLSYLGCSRQP